MVCSRISSLLALLACSAVVLSLPVTNNTSVHVGEVATPEHVLVNQSENQYPLAVVQSIPGSAVSPPLPLASDSVPSHLGSTSTFYRAVIKEELDYLTQNYPMDQSPPRHGTSGGDFTVDKVGGMYVFDVEAEAVVYGRCNSVTPIKEWPYFYIVTFQYTPNKKLSTKSFQKDDDSWRKLVDNCYKNIPHTFAAVEGPYSMYRSGKRIGAPQQGGGKDMLWQAALIGQDALKTLKVTKLRKVPTREGPFPSCTIF